MQFSFGSEMFCGCGGFLGKPKGKVNLIGLFLSYLTFHSLCALGLSNTLES